MQLGYWWNRSWGTMSSRKVWLNQLPDGRFEVTWRGGAWFDRPGRHVYSDPADVIAALKALLGEDKSARFEKLTLSGDPATA